MSKKKSQIDPNTQVEGLDPASEIVAVDTVVDDLTVG